MIVDSYGKMRFVRRNFMKVKKKLLRKESKAETHFEDLLIKANLYYVREKCNFQYDTRWCYYDFFIPYYRLYIEIDGESHNSKTQKDIDEQKEKYVDHKQMYLLRLKNEDVLKMESFDIDKILNLLFEQMQEKRHQKKRKSAEKEYFNNVNYNHEKAINDMRYAAKFDIDDKKKVYMYDNSTENTYEFDNIMVAKLHTQMTVNEIYDLLTEKEYKYHASRRYVFGWTIVECCINAIKGCSSSGEASHEGKITYEIKAELKRGRTCTKCPFSDNKIILGSEDCYKRCEFFRKIDIPNKILFCGYPNSDKDSERSLLQFKIATLREQIESLQREVEDYVGALESLN